MIFMKDFFRVSRFLFFIWFLLTIILFFAPISSFPLSMVEKTDKLSHIFIAFFTSLLFYISFKSAGGIGTFSFTIIYGGFVELIQGFLPFRSFSIFDLLTDTIGAGGFLILYFSAKSYLNRLFGS